MYPCVAVRYRPVPDSVCQERLNFVMVLNLFHGPRRTGARAPESLAQSLPELKFVMQLARTQEELVLIFL